MASIEEFEGHCWKDALPRTVLEHGFYRRCARETFVGPRLALLAIDLYNSAYRGGALPPWEIEDQAPNTCGIYAHQAIEPTKRLFAAARRAGLPIFYCTQDHRPNNRPVGAVSTKSRRPKPPTADDHMIYHEFTPHPEDVVLYKQRASVFQGTPILSHLTLLGIGSLIVCGESTSGCVRASVVDASSTGFHVSLVEECTYDRAEMIHMVNLFDLHHKYVDVMHLKEVEEHLARLAAQRTSP